MSLLSNFFTDIGAGVKKTESTNPADLPRFQNRSGQNTYAKHATNSWHNADSDSYWNMVAHVADVVSISQDNVYETVTNYTGGGYFFGVVTPSSNLAGAEVHIKVTIDGQVTILPNQLLSHTTPKGDITTSPLAPATNQRIHLGFFPFIGATTDSSSGGNGPHAFYDYGFLNYTGDIIGIGPDKYGVYGNSGHIATITPYDYMRFNLNRVRFENNLKVEIQMTNGNYTNPFNKTVSFWIKDSLTQ
jgi:hypothetical protein